MLGPEPRVDEAQMVLDSLLGDAKFVGDLAVGLAFGLADDHVALAWREPLKADRFAQWIAPLGVVSRDDEDDVLVCDRPSRRPTGHFPNAAIRSDGDCRFG